jgi:CheY-like chemotaxis protein
MTQQTIVRSQVLLVEDAAIIAMLMEDMLAEFSCDVLETVGELDAATAAAMTTRFDMAFVDVNLGGNPAYPVADILRARGIPFAFVTGYGSAGGAADYADVPVLQKPFRAQELEAIIERLRAQSNTRGS